MTFLDLGDYFNSKMYKRVHSKQMSPSFTNFYANKHVFKPPADFGNLVHCSTLFSTISNKSFKNLTLVFFVIFWLKNRNCKS